MCGIAGYFGTDALSESREKECLARMGRRGPDASGVFRHRHASGRNLTLLHSRLSIIDLDERANQPFTIGAHTFAFNGELYNYKELRASMQEEGVEFRTESDTEVFLQTLVRGGERGLDRCEGMWAFALFNAEAGTLLLSRDRFGEKPLYLFRDETGIYFGSEIKFIQALAGRKLKPNLDHLRRYLVNGYKSLYKGRETFFEGVEELSSRSFLSISADGKERRASYWEPTIETDDEMSYDEAVKGAREALTRSVELRLRADVPLAFCMSGGVDSNALISIAKRTFDYDVHGFTIYNEDQRYDEREMVEHSVKELGIRHTPVPVEKTEFLPRLRTLVSQHDAPVCTITYYAQWLLMSKIAEAGYKISISGTAADELFTGYYDHHLAYLYEVRKEPEIYKEAVSAWSGHIKPVVRNPHLQNPDLFVANPGFREHIFFKSDVFSGFLTSPWREDFREANYCKGLLRNRMLNELMHEIVPPILRADDFNAMYYSIENRSPFLDRSLFDFCGRIPNRHLIRDGFAKAVLRDAVRGIAPDRVIDARQKVGFNAPIFSFLDVRDPAIREELLKDSPIFEYVKRETIEDLIGQGGLPNSDSKFLFCFLNSKLFLEEHAG